MSNVHSFDQSTVQKNIETANNFTYGASYSDNIFKSSIQVQYVVFYSYFIGKVNEHILHLKLHS